MTKCNKIRGQHELNSKSKSTDYKLILCIHKNKYKTILKYLHNLNLI